jgi:hypothetical protein
MTEKVSELRQELRQARADLRQTSDEIRRRLTSDERRLARQVVHNSTASILIAAGLGFVIGRVSRHTAVLLALLTGAVVGYSLASREFEPDGEAE